VRALSLTSSDALPKESFDISSARCNFGRQRVGRRHSRPK
jgi:hypothetical protein